MRKWKNAARCGRIRFALLSNRFLGSTIVGVGDNGIVFDFFLLLLLFGFVCIVTGQFIFGFQWSISIYLKNVSTMIKEAVKNTHAYTPPACFQWFCWCASITTNRGCIADWLLRTKNLQNFTHNGKKRELSPLGDDVTFEWRISKLLSQSTYSTFPKLTSIKFNLIQ